MTEALTAIIAFAFDTLHLSSIIIDPIVGNTASEALAQHFGGKPYKVLRHTLYSKRKQRVYRVAPPLVPEWGDERPERCCRWCVAAIVIWGGMGGKTS